ncbi:hypothetical protein PHISP_08383, partial [Aspergillus sp. HF37]
MQRTRKQLQMQPRILPWRNIRIVITIKADAADRPGEEGENPAVEILALRIIALYLIAEQEQRLRRRGWRSNKPAIPDTVSPEIHKTEEPKPTEPDTPAADDLATSQPACTKTKVRERQPSQINRRLKSQDPDEPKPPGTNFLSLPPELRWQIYEHFFVLRRVQVLHQRNKDKDRDSIGHQKPRYRLYSRQLRPRNPMTQLAPTHPMQQPTPLPLSLILSCRTVYRETILQLYTQTQFILSSTKTAVRFLRTTSPAAQACIGHLELEHEMYNEPRLTEHRVFKLRSDMAWHRVCEDMAAAFSGLRVLHVHLTIWDWPIRLKVGEGWSVPLLFFGRDDGNEKKG